MPTRKLRILYVDETTGFGGGMVALRNLVAALDPAKYEAAIALRAENARVRAYLRDKLPRGVKVFAVRRWAFSQPAWPRRLGAQGAALAARAQWLLTFLADGLPTALRIASVAKRWKADAIHTNEQLLTNVAGILAARLAGVPCFSHNRMFGVNARLARYFLPLVAHCFAISEFIRKDLILGGASPSRITVVYDGVDLDQFSPGACAADVRREMGITPDRCVAGIFGRLVEWKGHEFFLRALALALREAPSLFGMVVGDTSPRGGPLMQRLKGLCRELGIGDRLVFTGYRTDVARLMSATQIVVAPSVEPEPAGLVNFEAMALSRPIIATRVGGIPELVADGVNGLLISVGDVAGFAEALVRLAKDRELAARLGGEGRRIVEQRYTARRYAEGVSKVYDRILGGRR
jgi:glycosyltransferase involved in cell wall biosynthesis